MQELLFFLGGGWGGSAAGGVWRHQFLDLAGEGFGSLVVTWLDYVNSTESAVFQLFLRSAVLSSSVIEITVLGSEVSSI